MPINKALLSGSTAMLLLKLLEEGDKYGYQMMEALAQRSDQTFQLKAGTLYPLLHDLEKQLRRLSGGEASAAVLCPHGGWQGTAAGKGNGVGAIYPGSCPSSGPWDERQGRV